MQVRRPPALTDGLGDGPGAAKAPGRSPSPRVVLVVVLIGALLLGLGLRVFVLRTLTVSSSSMSPTLCPGDRVVVDLWDPDIGDLAHDDLVALRPGKAKVPVVKRVVGLPGDEVAIRDALLYVNGDRVHEPYVDHKSIDALFYGPVVVPADRILVLGDARAVSIDSRAYGPVRSDRLLGRVVLRLPLGDC